ncbi:aldehyde dehydrogenase family protein [uncultured Tateyamaria sp.]|uniref:aldehyde dehydrogenase family protein n=1 Tax=Tateyamaria sp. 1078 TaxID=3417464 RepID=UPI002610B468|nr:aldehyde dehydrogenase family protein [uncultured Tateyamaria sp.]
MIDQAQINALRAAPVGEGMNLIGGQHVPAASGATLDSISPIDGTALARIAASGPEDVDRAVAAARAAFDDGRWSAMAPMARGRILQRIGDALADHAAELAVLGVRDNGTEIAMAFKAEPMSAAGTFRYYGELCGKEYGQIAPTAPGALGLVHQEPVGVVGAIVPWNFPMMIAAWKVAAALAAGNTVVLKPAEVASLSLLRLGDIAQAAGLPDGVLNILTGTGAAAGDALARHMDVDVLAFTGSGTVGRRLLEASAQSNLKRVYLELGGKSPCVVFADADLDAAARAVAGGIFRDSGQVCIAGARVLVERSVHRAFVDLLVEAAENMRVGDPLDLRTQAGAIASETQLNKILAACSAAQEAGAELRTGGQQLHADTGGFYVGPTIFDNAPQTSALVQDEIFGPVLAAQPFDTEDEATALANGTAYGLAAGVFTRDISRAHRMVGRLRAGVVHVNTYGGADVTVPLGGHGQSGNGHDKSPHALDKFRNLKTAWIAL